MSTALTIRPGTAADLEPLLALVHRAYRGDSARAGWTHEADLLGGQRTDRAALEAILADPAQRLLVAEEDGALIGCVQITDKGSGTAYLGLLTVDPARQAGGLGRRLLDAAEVTAGEVFGSERMEMSVIRQRLELTDYYRRRGYLLTGEERPFPLDDPRFGLPQRRDLAFVVLEKPLSRA
ncbi:GNAT family N-acetyltransferase [Sphingomonas sp. ID1715]|uniref:GNAT family N-acetyltransferase n=1 Tax=Sphingomonas sp. ID1715 TaxID=1656898 RepID=UPI0034A02E92